MSSELFIRNALSLAASVVIWCETIRSFEDERKLIWRRPINWVKAVYIMTRYSALVGSILNPFMLLNGPLRSFPNGQYDCRRWFSIFAIISCVPMFAIDAFSAIRMFVLYPNLRIGILTASLVITEVILVLFSSSDAMISATFTGTCEVVNTPSQIFAFVGWLIGTQAFLIGLTAHKLRYLKLSKDKRHGPTVHLVLQQGVQLCSLVLLITFGALGYSLRSGSSDPNIVSIWPNVLTSSALCRAILNLRKSAIKQDWGDNKRRSELDIQFTSWITNPSEDESSVLPDDGCSLLRRRICSSASSPYDTSRASTALDSSSASMIEEAQHPASVTDQPEGARLWSGFGCQHALTTTATP